MRARYGIFLASLLALAGPARADNVVDQLEAAKKYYLEGDINGAIGELEFVLQEIKGKVGQAYIATFPEALVEPCILAGSRPGDIVFDPFMGSGTVAQVAQNLGRKWIGSELNEEYIALQSGRTRQQGLEFTA